jgi:hypothetical protein
MIETNRVVAHYLDGRLVKGTTDDFMPNRPKFHLHQVGGGAPVEIECKKLKALFFVRDLAGQATRPDVHGFAMVAHEGNQGKKIAVEFKDGEVLFGYSLAYSTERDGFFMTPADVGSNNIRIYVMRTSTNKILVGAKAEALAGGKGTQAA